MFFHDVRVDFNEPDVLIHVRLFDSLVFRSSVLIPDLDLRLGEVECLCQFEAPRTRDVLHALKFHLQLQRLLACKCRPLSTAAALFAATARRNWNTNTSLND
jgi:hypothetical protein